MKTSKEWEKLLFKDDKDFDGSIFKITDDKWYHEGVYWGRGKSWSDKELDSCILGYTHPIQALIMAPLFGKLDKVVMWHGEAEVGKTSDLGFAICYKLKTIDVMPLAKVLYYKRIEYALNVSKNIYLDENFNGYAVGWSENRHRVGYDARKLAININVCEPTDVKPYESCDENAAYSALCALRSCMVFSESTQVDWGQVNQLVAKSLLYAKAAMVMGSLEVNLLEILENVMTFKST